MTIITMCARKRSGSPGGSEDMMHFSSARHARSVKAVATSMPISSSRSRQLAGAAIYLLNASTAHSSTSRAAAWVAPKCVQGLGRSEAAITLSRRTVATATMSSAPPNNGRLRFITNRRCPYAQKVWIALEEYAPRDYDLVEVSLYGGNGKPKWFRELNPKGQVPVLWLPSGQAICESDDIMDYLLSLPPPHDTQSNPLAPPSESALREWRSLVRPFLTNARRAVEAGDLYGLGSQLRTFERGMRDDDTCPFLGGERFSAVDATVFPFIQRVADSHDHVLSESAPRLHGWYTRVKDRASCRETTVQGGWWWW